jgi:hypothetical protein
VSAQPHERRIVLENPILREEAVRTTVQLLVGERCALAASAGLINAAESQRTKTYMATQVLDEARHVEVLSGRLAALGVADAELEQTVRGSANPDLLGLAETLLDPIMNGDFVVGIIGQNIILDEVASAAYELLATFNAEIDPAFADALTAMAADEQRHLEFGELCIRELVDRHPEKKAEIGKLAADLSRHLLHAFAELFRENPVPAELRRLRPTLGLAAAVTWQGVDLVNDAPERAEEVLVKTINARLRRRLGRIGVGYHPPRLAAGR